MKLIRKVKEILMKTSTFVVGMTVGLASMGLRAAEEQQDTMVVVGSRTPSQISEIPGTVWVVEAEEIQQQIHSGVDLKTALGKLVPGLDFGPQGRTNAGQNLRGRSVQVLIDGVSLNSSRGLSRQFDAIDPFNIARVEVLSGASSLYGGGATGGIINIVTKKGHAGAPTLETELSLTSGFNDSEDLDRRAAVAVAGGNDRLQGRLGVAYQDNGRQYDASGDEIFPDIAQSDLQGNRSIDIMGNLSFAIDAQQTLDVTAQLYDSGYEDDRGVYYPNLTAATPNLNDAEISDGFSADREPRTERKLVNVNYHHADLLGQDFYLQAFHREEEAAFHPFPYADRANGGYYFAASKQNTKLSGIKGLFSADPTDNLNVTYGLDFDREEFDASQMYFNKAITDATGGLVQEASRVTPRYPGFEVDSMAAFAQSAWWVTDSLQLSAGARQQHMDVEIDDFNSVPGGENDYDVTLFNAGVLYEFYNGHQVWTSYSEGFELPDPSKYYGRAGQTVSDNPLDGIKTRQVELGWRYRGNDWLTQAALYYAWSKKAIELDGDLNIAQIEDDRRDYGLEASATRFFGNHWEVGGTLHVLTSEQKIDDEWVDRGITVAPYPSQDTATLHVGWSDFERSVRLQANHAWDYEDYQNAEIEGFTTFDLLGSQQTDYGRFSLGVANLFDEQYSTPWGQRAVGFYSPGYGPAYLYDYQGRGRTYTLAWSAKF
ncbi:TonB-dependent receptor [Halomonas shantousis]